MSLAWQEEVLRLGGTTPLHGVVTRPYAEDSAPEVKPATALILLNAGLLHHVGSCCLSVQLAREAAANGILAVRFDSSGIGDSPVRNTRMHHEERSVAEAQEVVDYVRSKWGIKQFVMAGLCSGAFVSLMLAKADPDVVGIAAIAPFAHRTKRWYFNHYAKRLTSAKHWKKAILNRLGLGSADDAAYGDAYLDKSMDAAWATPSAETLQGYYKALLARGVQLHYTFTKGEISCYNYHGQMRDMYPGIDFGDSLIEHYLPNARHILTEPEAQEFVLEDTMHWMRKHWAQSTPGSAH